MRVTYYPERKSKGLGDTIDKITTATGIKKAVKMISNEESCTPCEERRKKLNELFPYKNQ
jgi:hypothetical protein